MPAYRLLWNFNPKYTLYMYSLQAHTELLFEIDGLLSILLNEQSETSRAHCLNNHQPYRFFCSFCEATCTPSDEIKLFEQGSSLKQIRTTTAAKQFRNPHHRFVSCRLQFFYCFFLFCAVYFDFLVNIILCV